MNIKLLRQVKRQILKEPRQFCMDNWFLTIGDVKWKIPNCGTAACIGGWAISLSSKLSPSEAQYNDKSAYQVLGLTQSEGVRLFYESNWPERFISYYGTTHLQKAKKAALRIEHFIKTKGQE